MDKTVMMLLGCAAGQQNTRTTLGESQGHITVASLRRRTSSKMARVHGLVLHERKITSK
jgi:hypothetical protein